jgi:hypothetical protein
VEEQELPQQQHFGVLHWKDSAGPQEAPLAYLIRQMLPSGYSL